uniref:Uncharacterized protein n=1 Tax=Eutreptiella gymnastica TaxID=73025 RepID=A0A7S1NA98_9EUGL|mmetsp:Transcript_145337/g.253621  ORF Transcript_145337/g.253621 Transcript_145337/m.253621 type:complete len:370 (+) Transcript_145337:119-1228(+)
MSSGHTPLQRQIWALQSMCRRVLTQGAYSSFEFWCHGPSATEATYQNIRTLVRAFFNSKKMSATPDHPLYMKSKQVATNAHVDEVIAEPFIPAVLHWICTHYEDRQLLQEMGTLLRPMPNMKPLPGPAPRPRGPRERAQECSKDLDMPRRHAPTNPMVATSLMPTAATFKRTAFELPENLSYARVGTQMPQYVLMLSPEERKAHLTPVPPSMTPPGPPTRNRRLKALQERPSPRGTKPNTAPAEPLPKYVPAFPLPTFMGYYEFHPTLPSQPKWKKRGPVVSDPPDAAALAVADTAFVSRVPGESAMMTEMKNAFQIRSSEPGQEVRIVAKHAYDPRQDHVNVPSRGHAHIVSTAAGRCIPRWPNVAAD